MSRTLHVLIVEDDPLLGLATSESLRLLGSHYVDRSHRQSCVRSAQSRTFFRSDSLGFASWRRARRNDFSEIAIAANQISARHHLVRSARHRNPTGRRTRESDADADQAGIRHENKPGDGTRCRCVVVAVESGNVRLFFVLEKQNIECMHPGFSSVRRHHARFANTASLGLPRDAMRKVFRLRV